MNIKLFAVAAVAVIALVLVLGRGSSTIPPAPVQSTPLTRPQESTLHPRDACPIADGYYATRPMDSHCTLVDIPDRPFAMIHCGDHRDGFMIVTGPVERLFVASCAKVAEPKGAPVP